MITAHQRLDGTVSLELDEADQAIINKLARAYVIPYKDMIVACLNKGIDVIGEQVAATERKKQDEQETDNSGAGGD